MSRRPPSRTRSISEYLPSGGKLAELVARARRLEAIDRLLPGVLGLGEASGLRAVRIADGTVTLGTDAPGRAYRLRYAKPRLLEAIRRLPGLEAVERVEVRTLAGMPAPEPAAGGRALGAGSPEGVSRRPPDAAALRAVAADCTDAGLRAVLERLARHARSPGGD